MQADPVATRGPQALAVVALLALATLSAPAPNSMSPPI